MDKKMKTIFDKHMDNLCILKNKLELDKQKIERALELSQQAIDSLRELYSCLDKVEE